MSDIVFECTACGKRLAIDEAAFGAKVPCTDCGQVLSVPEPALEYLCMTCHDTILLEEPLVGKVVSCPVCQNEALTMWSWELPRDQQVRHNLRGDDERSGRARPKVVLIPASGAQLSKTSLLRECTDILRKTGAILISALGRQSGRN